MKPFKIVTSLLIAVAFTLLAAPVFGNEIALAFGTGIFALQFVPMPTGILGMNTQAARMVYDNAQIALARAFPGQDIRQFKCTQSFLRLEQALSITQTRYQFQILNQTTGAGFNTEQRLNLQDSFVVSGIGIFLGKPSSSTDTTFELDTYGNTVKYTNAAAMNAVYNGVMQITVNNDVILPAWDLSRHFYRPQTQQTAAANSPLDQKRLAEDAFYAVEPNITAIGSKNTQITINLQAALSAVDANSRLIVVLRGVLAQNSTVVS
jgi:hypothetical protein